MPFQKMPGVDLDVTDFDMRVVEVPPPYAAPILVMPPQTVIQANQPWRVEVRWKVTGLSATIIPGNWHLEAYLECMGPGNNFEAAETGPAPATTPDPPMGSISYVAHMDIVAGTVPVTAGETSTPYKLTVTLTAVNPAGAPYPMAGYLEGPILQFTA